VAAPAKNNHMSAAALASKHTGSAGVIDLDQDKDKLAQLYIDHEMKQQSQAELHQ